MWGSIDDRKCDILGYTFHIVSHSDVVTIM